MASLTLQQAEVDFLVRQNGQVYDELNELEASVAAMRLRTADMENQLEYDVAEFDKICAQCNGVIECKIDIEGELLLANV